MSEAWIKVRTVLPTDGRLRIASRKCHASTVTCFGALVTLWCLADSHADENGVLNGYTVDDVDALLGLPGFCNSLPVDWIDVSGEYVKLPNYQQHNGSTGRTRAQATKRKQLSRSQRDTSVTREEKKREEEIDTPIAPKGASSRAKKISLADYLAECEAQRADPIPANDGVWKYPETMGLPADWIPLAWWAFQGRYLAKPGEKVVRYLSWPQAFRNAVRENWLRLWWLKDGAYELTTAGQQALREMRTDR